MDLGLVLILFALASMIAGGITIFIISVCPDKPRGIFGCLYCCITIILLMTTLALSIGWIMQRVEANNNRRHG